VTAMWCSITTVVWMLSTMRVAGASVTKIILILSQVHLRNGFGARCRCAGRSASKGWILPN